MKQALLVGVGGSLWFKAVEYYFWYRTGTSLTYLVGMLPFQLVSLLMISVPLTLFFYYFKKNWGLSFVPSLYYIIKDSLNVLFGNLPASQIPYSAVEAIVIGLPIGITWYFLAYKTDWVTRWGN